MVTTVLRKNLTWNQIRFNALGFSNISENLKSDMASHSLQAFSNIQKYIGT